MLDFFQDYTQKQMTKVVDIIKCGTLVEDHDDYCVFLYCGNYYFLAANGLYKVEVVEGYKEDDVKPIAFIGLGGPYKRFHAHDKNLYFKTSNTLYKVLVD